MLKINKTLTKIVATAVTACMLITPIAVNAKNVANGELIFTGGQISSVVYSDISDAKPHNSHYYKVIAKVKVGGNVYTSGWKNDKAYVQHDRHWYANELSYYDYYER